MTGLPALWASAPMQGMLYSQFSDNLGGRTVRPVAKGLILTADYVRGWLGYLGHQRDPSTWLRESGPLSLEGGSPLLFMSRSA